jgi:hypothetical protein
MEMDRKKFSIWAGGLILALLLGWIIPFIRCDDISADLGRFYDGTGARDTVWMSLATFDTTGQQADADSVWFIRLFRTTVIDTVKLSGAGNIGTGYYSTGNRAFDGTNYGNYTVKKRWKVQTKYYGKTDNYTVFPDSVNKVGTTTNLTTWDKTGYTLTTGERASIAESIVTSRGVARKYTVGGGADSVYTKNAGFDPATTPVVSADTNVSGDTLVRQKDSTSFQSKGFSTHSAEDVKALFGDTLEELTIKLIALQDSLDKLKDSLNAYYADLNDDSSGGGGATPAEIWEYSGQRTIHRADTAGYLLAGAGAGASASEVADTLSNRGWMIGNGANLCSLWIFTIDDTTPAISVPVYLKNSALTATLAQNLSSTTGGVPFKLSNGSYRVLTNSPAYPQVNDYDTFTVSGVSQDTIWVSKFDPGTPSEPYLCKVWNCTYKLNGLPDSGAIIEMKIKQSPLKWGNIIISPYSVKDTTDGDGYFSLDVFPNSSLTPDSTVYQILIRHTDGRIFNDTLTVPDSINWRLIW